MLEAVMVNGNFSVIPPIPKLKGVLTPPERAKEIAKKLALDLANEVAVNAAV